MKQAFFLVMLVVVSLLIVTNVYAQSIPLNSTSSNSSPVVTPPPAITPPPSALNYTPLPTNTGGPENDIIESSPLTASRTIAQVDDYITFTVTIQNRAPYNKTLLNVCFESSDGNFGCAWDIKLAPGQTYTINNAGTWTSSGTKQISITWSQDGVNYYHPLNAATPTVFIQG